jgi:hypothetical protein
MIFTKLTRMWECIKSDRERFGKWSLALWGMNCMNPFIVKVLLDDEGMLESKV